MDERNRRVLAGAEKPTVSGQAGWVVEPGHAVRASRDRDDGEPLVRQPARRPATDSAGRLRADVRTRRGYELESGRYRYAGRRARLPVAGHVSGFRRLPVMEGQSRTDQRRQDGRVRQDTELRPADGLLHATGAPVRVLARIDVLRCEPLVLLPSRPDVPEPPFPAGRHLRRDDQDTRRSAGWQIASERDGVLAAVQAPDQLGGLLLRCAD